MRRDQALEILTDHKDKLREKFGVTSIAIFGSTARDEAGPDSDVDTLIEIERPAAPAFINPRASSISPIRDRPKLGDPSPNALRQH